MKNLPRNNSLKEWIIYTTLLVLAFISLGCGGDEEVVQPPVVEQPPEVYLVKDSDTEFHLEWDKRLGRNQVILVQFEYTGNQSMTDVRALVDKETLQSDSLRLPEKIGSFVNVINLSVASIESTDGSTRFINPDFDALPNWYTWAIVKDDTDSFHIELKPHPVFSNPLSGSYIFHIQIEYVSENTEKREELLYFPVRSVRSGVYSGYKRVMILPAKSLDRLNLPAEALNVINNEPITVQAFSSYNIGTPDELIFE